MDDMKTKFHTYTSFGITSFDTTPEADNDDGMIEIPSITLDGEFTVEDVRAILAKMESLLANKVYFEKMGRESIFPLVLPKEEG